MTPKTFTPDQQRLLEILAGKTQIVSLGAACQHSGLSTKQILRWANTLNIEPSLTIDYVIYFEHRDIVRICEAIDAERSAGESN